MTDVLATPVLVLNKHFEPVRISTARRAFALLYGRDASAIDENGDAYDFDLWRSLPVREEDDEVSIVGGALRVPRVLHLHRYDRSPRPQVRLTRHNVMLRDGHQCQYCGARPPLRDLNIDHVLPRSRGGPDSWENLVTACRPCNLRKGWRTPEEAGMRLAKRPQRPTWSMSAQILMHSNRRFHEWEPFLRAG
jgi:5-methylcytosine-specific restriction endonuclease McrA